MKTQTKIRRKSIGPVLHDGPNALVCQRCLVKWARVRGVFRVFCNTCARQVSGEVKS